MGLGISIKDEKKEEDPKKDITKWPREVLEDRYKKKQKFYMIGLIIVAAMFMYQMIGNINTQSDLSDAQSALKTCVSDTIKACDFINNSTILSSTKSDLVQGVTDFFKWITQINQPYFYKIMILLGILYLVQIIFACVTDIVEVALLVFVLIKRIVLWIWNKIVSIPDNGKT